jgi:hypothetical protein
MDCIVLLSMNAPPYPRSGRLYERFSLIAKPHITIIHCNRGSCQLLKLALDFRERLCAVACVDENDEGSVVRSLRSIIECKLYVFFSESKPDS